MNTPKTTTNAGDDPETGAYVLGYWSRVHDLDLIDIEDDPDLVGDDLDVGKYREGWSDADAELRRERIEKLKARLADVETNS